MTDWNIRTTKDVEREIAAMRADQAAMKPYDDWLASLRGPGYNDAMKRKPLHPYRPTTDYLAESEWDDGHREVGDPYPDEPKIKIGPELPVEEEDEGGWEPATRQFTPGSPEWDEAVRRDLLAPLEARLPDTGERDDGGWDTVPGTPGVAPEWPNDGKPHTYPGLAVAEHAFNKAVNQTLDQARAISDQRGGEYLDSWALENTYTPFQDYALALPHDPEDLTVTGERAWKRIVLVANLIDVKISRLSGPYKADTLVDLVNYLAAFASWVDAYHPK